jgi:hypothetical protein
MVDALTTAHAEIRNAHKAVFQAALEHGWLYGLDDAYKLLDDAMTQVQGEINAQKAGEEARFIAYQV